MRFVVLGGSGSSTPELIDAFESWPGGIERRPPLELVLVGRTADRLEAVAAGCRDRLSGAGAPIAIETSMDRRRALIGADVVLNQVRIGGYAARAFDERFPQAHGVPGEETVGPGGFANACRTLPALASTWTDIAAVAPLALVVNLTNPAGIAQTAAHGQEPALRVISVCDAPLPVLDAVAQRLGCSTAEVRSRYVGMNHMGWYVAESAAELERVADLATGLTPDEVRVLGALPNPYVRYYLHPDRILAGQLGKPTRAETLMDLERRLLDGYRAGSEELPRRGAVVWYRLAVAALVDAWRNGADLPVILGRRNDGLLPSLPADATIELAHRADGPANLVPVTPPELPPLPAALLAAHAHYEVMAARAAAGGSRDDRLRALIANPMVPGYDVAEALLSEMELHQEAGRS